MIKKGFTKKFEFETGELKCDINVLMTELVDTLREFLIRYDIDY